MQPEGFEHFSHFSLLVFLVKQISSEAQYHPTALAPPLWILKEKAQKKCRIRLTLLGWAPSLVVWDTSAPCLAQLLLRHQSLAFKHSPQQPPGPSSPAQRARALPLQTLTAVLLIRLVLAVLVPIALPVEVDAFAVAALELVCRARVEGLGVVAAPLHGLVRLVLAVGLVVTHPLLGDAHAVVALELVGVAGQRGALPFIAAIPAVVVTVTHEDDGDARLVTALELVGRTGLGMKTNR